MAKEKVTITVDRAKLAAARDLLGVPSASAAIDVALAEVVRRGRLLRDIEAYASTPPTAEDVAFAEARPEWADLFDDTDWDAQWPEHR